MTDHLPIPPNPLHSPITVPCLGEIPYDELDFASYPARRGWDITRLKSGIFDQYARGDTAAFLQDWLYFGVLFQTVDAQKAHYVVPDPACKYGRVTTKTLRNDVVAQLERLDDNLNYGSGPQDVVERAQRWLQEAEACVTTLQYFCHLARSAEMKGYKDAWPVPPEVDLSFRVLGVTLAAMCTSMTIRLGKAGVSLRGLDFRGSSLSESRMHLAEWCPSEISRAAAEFSSSSMHYISMLRRVETGRDHGQCTSTKCEAFFTDAATYQTQHAIQICDCQDVFPDVGKIVSIIGSGKLPLLTIKMDENDEPQITVEAYKTGMEYVAISHVWADGLGNSQNNALPKCQLSRLKGILDELNDSKSLVSMLNSFRVSAIVRRQRNISVRFWFDTICIPLEQVDKKARKTAIKTMRHVYKNAYQILVLDKELMGTDHVTILDSFMRCSLSGWMRRLWTLQEAVLGDRLFVKFKNTIIDVQACYETLQNSSTQQHYETDEELPLALDRFYGSPFSDCLQFYYRMRGMRDWLHAPEERKLTQLIKSKRIENADTIAADECRGVMAAFEASRYRTTSKKEDVFICLGNLLGYDESLSEVPQNERVRTILQHKTTLPQGILFIPGPRARTQGWRWSVSDFDCTNQSLMTGDIDDSRPMRMDPKGIAVSYPGLILPHLLELNCPEDFVMPVCVDSNGSSKAWWRFTLLPMETSAGIAVNAASTDADIDSRYRTHCMLFFSKDQIMRANVHMAAALVSVEMSDLSKISDVRTQLVCQFVRLAVLQYIGGDYDLHVLRQRRDVALTVLDKGFAWPVYRNWTIE